MSGLTSLKKKVSYLKKLLELNNADAFFINHLPNVFYLTGFTGSSGIVIITKNRNYFFTDFRYKIQSAKEVSELFKIIIANRFEEIFDIFGDRKIKILCEKESLNYENYEFLRKKKKYKVIPVPSPVYSLRMYKNDKEIKKIKKAQRNAEKILKKALEALKPGKTKEIELASEIEYLIKREGYGVAFPTIVATGRHSALPHAKPRNVVIKNNTVLLIDMGCIYKGYHSDMTRTFWIGSNPPDWFKKIYQITLDAVLKAEEGVKKSMHVKEIDRIARDYIKEKGYGDKFGHGLGHGVGVEIHEKPSVSPKGKEKLEKGMVFTIEPGIYLETKGGVRIEDLVYVNEKGNSEIITKFPKRLIKI